MPLRADLFEETRVPDAFEEGAAFAGFPDAPDCADEDVVLAREVFGDAAVHELWKVVNTSMGERERDGMGMRAHL